jgi:hypothetical protein
LNELGQTNAVAMAQLHIRLGIQINLEANLIGFLAFLRKVLGILAFQFVATVILCTAFYMTEGVKTFIQQQFEFHKLM